MRRSVGNIFYFWLSRAGSREMSGGGGIRRVAWSTYLKGFAECEICLDKFMNIHKSSLRCWWCPALPSSPSHPAHSLAQCLISISLSQSLVSSGQNILISSLSSLLLTLCLHLMVGGLAGWLAGWHGMELSQGFGQTKIKDFWQQKARLWNDFQYFVLIGWLIVEILMANWDYKGYSIYSHQFENFLYSCQKTKLFANYNNRLFTKYPRYKIIYITSLITHLHCMCRTLA